VERTKGDQFSSNRCPPPARLNFYCTAARPGWYQELAECMLPPRAFQWAGPWVVALGV